MKIPSNINEDETSNVKAASPAAVKSFVEGKEYVTEQNLQNSYATKSALTEGLAVKVDAASVSAALALKANAADVTAQIAAAIGSVSSFEYYLCGEGEYDAQTGVPTVQNPDTEHIYLVPTSGTNLNMYGYINSTFTFLGTTEMDMTGYVQENDLAEVAFSGSYEDLDDTPDIPTRTSDLTNDSGFITAPETVIFEKALASGESYAMGNAFIGGVEHAYAYVIEITQEMYQKTFAETGTVYIKPNGTAASKTTYDDVAVYMINGKPTETGAETGFDVVDSTKPCCGISVYEDDESSTGYASMIVSSSPVDNITWQLVTRGSYLTEHQSIASIAAALNLAQVAYTGSYNNLSNTPTIPTISKNINSDAGSDAKAASPKAVKTFVEGKGYLTQHQSLADVNATRLNGLKISVDTEAPDAGTPNSTITIVVPE